MKTKKKSRGVYFKDPNISDREMLHLILFVLAKLGREVKFIKEYVALDKAQITRETDAKLFEFCHSKAFAEMEADMLQFVRWSQKKNRKVDLN